MEETKCKCAECERREELEREANELNFAVLVALVPILTITFFSNIGLL
jgi:hypothetical protein